MEIQFNITVRFDADLKRFSTADQKLVAASLDKHAATFRIDDHDVAGDIFQPYAITLPDDLDSSLYALKIDDRILVILIIEEDPIFERIAWTLMRAVRRQEFEQAFLDTVEALYPDLRIEDWKHG
jgi:hypothetical protein